ncbi:hypothetical protein GGI12_004186 [Dipsacomyces acuminosporus]|nr:hypothetical protein GGI12_004186 [Dipsacomyces acuminosporus]
MKLTQAGLEKIISKPLVEATAIDLKGKGIEQIGDISACVQLRKLVLANNNIGSNDDLKGIRDIKSLAYLDISGNQLEDIDVIENLPRLNVLNLSNNRLAHIPAQIASCSDLKALIVGHNNIKRIENIEELANLNTLVVSHNEVKDVPSLPQLKELTKLSAAHNKIRKIPDLTLYPKLKEVRLNDNKIELLPESIRSCQSIQVVDLGNNLLSDWTSVAPLASLQSLHNLNLKGNPVCKEDDYRNQVIKLIPSLRVLDGVRFDKHYLRRKEKKKAKDALQSANDIEEAPNDDTRKEDKAPKSNAERQAGKRSLKPKDADGQKPFKRRREDAQRGGKPKTRHALKLARSKE